MIKHGKKKSTKKFLMERQREFLCSALVIRFYPTLGLGLGKVRLMRNIPFR